MNKIIPLLAFFFSMTLHAQNLSDYQWKKRLVLVVSSNLDSEKVKTQLQHFENDKEAFEERDMLTLKYKSTEKALSRLNIKRDFEGVVLIGKDGGLKERYTFLVEPQKIFALVDSMPMRKAEIRRKKGE